MSDGNENVTAGQPAQAAAQPVPKDTGTQVAAPAPQIDPGEFARLQRVEQQYKGTYKQLNELGFKDFSELARFKTVFEKIKDPEAFQRAWDGEPSEQDRPLTLAELDKYYREREAQKREEEAHKSHFSTWEEDQAALAEERIAEVLKDVPKELRPYMKNFMSGVYSSLRPDYEPDHPFHGKYAKPLGKEGMAKVYSEATAFWEAAKKHFQGAHLAAVGEAATKAQSSGTPAGHSPTGQAGKEKGAGTRSDRTRNYVRETAAKMGLT